MYKGSKKESDARIIQLGTNFRIRLNFSRVKISEIK